MIIVIIIMIIAVANNNNDYNRIISNLHDINDKNKMLVITVQMN